MPESTNDRRRVDEEPSAETTTVKQEWHAPALTMLGDARTLTETGGMVSLDGAGSSKIS